MSVLGHNGGPAFGTGRGWQRYAWRHARRQLLPRLPIEIVRRRVRRARELGLDYDTYATVQATTGRDIVAFLFSTNALGLALRDRPAPGRTEKLRAIEGAERRLLANPPRRPDSVVSPLGDPVFAGPGPWDSWSETRTRLRAALASGAIPSDAVVLVGDTGVERGWCAVAGLAGYVPAERYFNDAPE
ncbi:hypothetical protein SAMN04490244_101579 [Tranquillimonas rosea]|uniref:Uncharacterized protein n=1 Tax=Tranquillimonas rosea TaxID=641238 RepID=A0A1H9QD86_9RHOB|nr:hypothetical protein [Tranquillimonas rosea]SER58434.1 hypothetical protein SAMN04490244_101579 [Tranquillimonas rosea]